MKKIYIIALAIAFPLWGISQTTIYSENFESGVGLWSLGTSSENSWIRNNVYLGSFFNDTPNQPSAVTGYPNSYYMHIGSATASLLGDDQAVFLTGSAGTVTTTMNTSISTAGYTGVVLSFYYLSNGVFTGLSGFDSYGLLEYSINGGSIWTQIGSAIHSTTNWTLFSIILPALDNQATLKLRFKWITGSLGSDPPFAIDQILITGGQQITTGSISPLSYCAGDNVSVPFTAGTLSVGNVFTAKLSDASGSFSPGTGIGTLASTTSGTISATIPAPTPSGTGYRIRVDASSPASIGLANTSNITINSVGSLAATASPTTLCPGQSSTLSATGAASFTWMPGSLSGTSVTVNPSSTTTYTATGTVGSCSGTTTVTVSTYSPTAVNLSPFSIDTICKTLPSFALPTATPSGGVYSGTGVSGSNFDPSIASLGLNYVLYCFTDGNTCTSCDSTALFIETCGSVSEINRSNSFSVFPNPSSGSLNIMFNGNPIMHEQILIYDVLGNLVHSESARQPVIRFKLSAGIYFIRSSNPDQKSMKILIN